MQRVVYNTRFGGFSIDASVVEWVREHEERLKNEYSDTHVNDLTETTLPGEIYPDGSGPRKKYATDIRRIQRDNELLADIVSGETTYDGKIDGQSASLQVAEVPDGIDWTIDIYDGKETVKEQTQTFD